MEYAPITSRMRDLAAKVNWAGILEHTYGEVTIGEWLRVWHEETESALDAIDAIHAALEHENATLRERADPNKVTLQVLPFVRDDDKAAALKPLEEAAEIYGAWEEVRDCEARPWPECDCKGHRDGCRKKSQLGYEIADTITACVNLAQRYGIDLPLALERVERANKDRGRYD